MTHESFLSRVRTAAAAGRKHRVFADQPLAPLSPHENPSADLVGQMAAEIELVGGRSYMVADADAARSVLAEIIVNAGASKALCWRHPLLQRIGLAALLQERGVTRLDYENLAAEPPERRKELMLSADIGITSSTWAIAETGSLAMASSPGCERLASLAPPVHVAIIESGQILPDLFALFSRYQSAELPSNLTLITGPSKTGDIEMELTTGVHGPGQWHVIIIRD